jgi:hypothetical protein
MSGKPSLMQGSTVKTIPGANVTKFFFDEKWQIFSHVD